MRALLVVLLHACAGQRLRLVFSVNAGRSGSAYLARLLGLCSNTTSTHEEQPNMSGYFMRRAALFGLEATRAERADAKLPALLARLRELRAPPPGAERERRGGVYTYADTSNMWHRTWADLVAGEGEAARATRERLADAARAPGGVELVVVALRRNLPATMASFQRLAVRIRCVWGVGGDAGEGSRESARAIERGVVFAVAVGPSRGGFLRALRDSLIRGFRPLTTRPPLAPQGVGVPVVGRAALGLHAARDADQSHAAALFVGRRERRRAADRRARRGLTARPALSPHRAYRRDSSFPLLSVRASLRSRRPRRSSRASSRGPANAARA